LKYKDDDLSEPPERVLFDWPRNPMEDHADICIPDKGKVFADKMVEEMSARVMDDPSIPLSRHKENVHLLWKIKYEEDDPELWQDILRNLPSDDVKRLNTIRIKLTGSVPKSRDDFNARPFLDKVIGGKNVIVLDSNNLPDTKEGRDAIIENAFNHRDGEVPSENQTFVDEEEEEPENETNSDEIIEETNGTKIIICFESVSTFFTFDIH
jgi:hypothetical protein